jgi:hypothetical protein
MAYEACFWGGGDTTLRESGDGKGEGKENI